MFFDLFGLVIFSGVFYTLLASSSWIGREIFGFGDMLFPTISLIVAYFSFHLINLKLYFDNFLILTILSIFSAGVLVGFLLWLNQLFLQGISKSSETVLIAFTSVILVQNILFYYFGSSVKFLNLSSVLIYDAIFTQSIILRIWFGLSALVILSITYYSSKITIQGWIKNFELLICLGLNTFKIKAIYFISIFFALSLASFYILSELFLHPTLTITLSLKSFIISSIVSTRFWQITLFSFLISLIEAVTTIWISPSWKDFLSLFTLLTVIFIKNFYPKIHGFRFKYNS